MNGDDGEKKRLPMTKKNVLMKDDGGLREDGYLGSCSTPGQCRQWTVCRSANSVANKDQDDGLLRAR